jgi:hypothetical protein
VKRAAIELGGLLLLVVVAVVLDGQCNATVDGHRFDACAPRGTP